MKFRLKAAVAGGLALGMGLGGGVAIAAWIADGGGSGSAKAVTALALTTEDASGSASASLYPGATNLGTLTVKIKNPNPYPVKVTDIVQSGTVTATGGTGSCTTTGVSLTALSGLSDVIAANSSATFTHTNTVSMDNTSEDGCQGAKFTIPVSVSGHSGS